jgi:hypothetical protein
MRSRAPDVGIGEAGNSPFGGAYAVGMTRYVGTAELGDEMTATVSIDDIDGYSWRGNIQAGEGHHALEIGAVRVVLRDGEHAGKWADAQLGLDTSGDLHFFGEHPFRADDARP